MALIPPLGGLTAAPLTGVLAPLSAVRPILGDYASGALSPDQARASLASQQPTLSGLGVLPFRLEAFERFLQGGDYPRAEAGAFAQEIGLLESVHTYVNGNAQAAGSAIPLADGLVQALGISSSLATRRPSLLPPASRSVPLMPSGMEEKIICPHCEADNLKDSNFCRGCRAELGESALLKAPERRFCTIMFIDYKGFTAASESLEAGLLGDIINRHAKALGSIIVSHGGRIIKPTGDGLYAVWGTGRATEDDAVNAVKAGLRMQREIDRLGETLRADGHPSFKMRIGINSGDVWVGYIEGPGVHWFDVLGKAVNRAARAESEAPVGGVLILEPTLKELHRRGDPIETTPEGVLKGKREGELGEEITTHVALRIRPEEETSEDRQSLITELVGRHTELQTLSQEYLRSVVHSRASLVILRGEAGMGKSRLERAFRDTLHDASPQPLKLRIRSEDAERKVPYKAVMDLVRRAVRIHPEDSAETIRRHLEDRLPDTGLDLHLLSNFLGITFEDVPEDFHLIANDPSALRERTLDAVTALFRNLSHAGSILLILEDLHWMDAASIDFIERLLERLKDTPLFVLGLSRPKPASTNGDARELKPELPTQTLQLEAVSADALERMLTLLFPEGLDPGHAAFLAKESAGNPFLLQEMARALKEGWKILKDDLTGGLLFQDAKGHSVPAGAQSFLETRIDTLPSALRSALKELSVIGLELGRDDAKEILGRQAESMLEDLVSRQFLRKSALDRYEFVHARIRETAYQRMDEKTRGKLHRRWARYLEKERSFEPALIGHHYEQARVPELAAEYFFKAGEQIAKRDFQSAEKLYRHAYDLAAGQPKAQFRYLKALDNVLYLSGQFTQEIDLYELATPLLKELPPIDHAGHRYRRGRALIRLGRFADAMNSLEDARMIAEKLSLDDPGLKKLTGHILVDLAVTKTFLGEMDISEALNQRALEIGRETRDDLVVARALWTESHRASRRGEHHASLIAAQEANTLFYKLGESLRYVMTLMNVGWSQLALGALPEAEATLRRALDLSQRRFKGEVQAMESLYDSLGRVLSLRGRHEEAVELLRKNIEDRPDHSFIVYNYVYLSQALLAAGNTRDAEETARQALAKALARNDKPDQPTEAEAAARMGLAQNHLHSGHPEEALAESKKAMKLLEKLGGVETFGLEIPLTQVRILLALERREEALPVLEHLHKQLAEQLARIPEESPYRSTFLQDIATHREIRRLFASLNP